MGSSPKFQILRDRPEITELHLVNISTRVSSQRSSFKLKTRVSMAQLCFVVLPLFAQTGRLYYWCVKILSMLCVCVFVYVPCVLKPLLVRHFDLYNYNLQVYCIIHA